MNNYIFKLQFRPLFAKFKNMGYSEFCGYKVATAQKEIDDENNDENGEPLELCTRCVEGFFECNIQYDVLIHNSKETLTNDLDTGLVVKMGLGETVFAEISKSNLDSISTEKNPCIYHIIRFFFIVQIFHFPQLSP